MTQRVMRAGAAIAALVVLASAEVARAQRLGDWLQDQKFIRRSPAK